MNEVTFQHLRVSGKRCERASIVLDNIWFEKYDLKTARLKIAMCSTAAGNGMKDAPSDDASAQSGSTAF
jgi:hypothetical protein